MRIVISILLATILPVTLSVNYSYSLYSEAKQYILFPAYTGEERKDLSSNIQKMFTSYVNRESKIFHYKADPIPIFDQIQSESDSMSDKDFHLSVSRAFLSTRDLHTNYHMPGPYGCYRTILPIMFEAIDSDDLIKNPIVVVTGFSSVNKVLEFSPGIKDIVQIGDQLISYNGKSFKQMYREFKSISNGANDYGGMRSVLNLMAFRSAMLTPLQEETEVVYIFKRNSSSPEFKVIVPIVARSNVECVKNSRPTSLSDHMSTGTEIFPDLNVPKMSIKNQLDEMSNPFLQEMSETFDSESSTFKFQETKESIVKWDIYEKDDFKMGILRLESFTPSESTIPETVLLIRELLLNELKDTDALVIDLRSNGGGKMSLADSIPQLFKSPFYPNNGRALNSPLNKIIFNTETYVNSDWAKALENIGNDTYSKLASFTEFSTCNRYGAAYIKPVAALTNANCYSSCDLLSANIQDSQTGMIYGTDGKTGAGGGILFLTSANVVKFVDFFLISAPNEFKPLPKGQDMRMGWRQSVRNGVNKGKLIEDDGVQSDKIFRPSILDITRTDKRSSIFDRIADELKIVSINTERYNTSIWIDPRLERDSLSGTHISFEVLSSWITRIDLIQDKFLVDSIIIPKSINISRSELQSEVIKASKFLKFTINSFVDSNLIFSTYRYLRTVPKTSDFLLLESGKTIVADYHANYSVIYNKQSKFEGWNPYKNGMAIQNGLGYSNNVNSKISFFIRIPQPLDFVPVFGCVSSTFDWFDLRDTDQWKSIVGSSIFRSAYISSFLNKSYFGDLSREMLTAKLNVANGSFISTVASEALKAAEVELIKFINDVAEFNKRNGSREDFDYEKTSKVLSDFNSGSYLYLYPGNAASCYPSPTLYIQASYDTEEDCDFLKLETTYDGKTETLVSLSGSGTLDQEFSSIDLVGKDVEVSVSFTSDPAKTVGPVIVKMVKFFF